jgi:acyl-CoA synthetase (AMP-forming)/AMP-acid ligase II
MVTSESARTNPAPARPPALPDWYPPDRVARFYELGLWGPESLTSIVETNARLRPDELCVADSRRSLTFGEAERLSAGLAGSLIALGVEPGDRVVVQLPNWWQAVVAYYAIARIGAVFVPRMMIYREHEVRDAIERTEATLFITADRFRNFEHGTMGLAIREQTALEHVVVIGSTPAGALNFDELLTGPRYAGPAPDPDQLHIILFTSGTTAKAKGVMHSFNTYVACSRALRDGLELSGRDRCFMPSPVMHNTGLQAGVLLPALLGGATVLQDVWEVHAAMDMIGAHRCSYTVGATPFVTMLLDAFDPSSDDLSSMRVFNCGGAPVPASVVRDTSTRLGFRLAVSFGQSECHLYSITRANDSVDRVASSDGRAALGNELIVVDDDGERVPPGQEGEICCRGGQIMLGYLGEPGLTAETIDADGFCHSGDLGRMDADGYIRITGRKKDIIIRGGNNITPLEIEEMLLEHPKVAQIAVIGFPDHRLGERVCAVVVPTAAGAPTLAELASFLGARRLAKQKLPERLELVDALPMNATGKVEKFQLRKVLFGAG